jgi:hypothetical protein
MRQDKFQKLDGRHFKPIDFVGVKIDGFLWQFGLIRVPIGPLVASHEKLPGWDQDHFVMSRQPGPFSRKLLPFWSPLSDDIGHIQCVCSTSGDDSYQRNAYNNS